jgi:two-component system, chemotaxis family, chemotaxis protein CheY
VLRFGGFRVDAVGNGHLALEKLRRSEPLPSLLVLDLEMPVMNGWELIAELKKSPQLAAIPYVIFSAYGCRHERVTSLDADGCVSKGGSTFELLRVVERCTGRTRAAQALRIS